MCRPVDGYLYRFQRVVVQCALAILLAGTRHTGLLADARELRLDGEFDVAGFHSYPINFFTLPCVKSCRLLSLVSGYFSIRFHSMLIAWLFEDDANRKVFAIDIPGGDSDIINVILLNNMREVSGLWFT